LRLPPRRSSHRQNAERAPNVRGAGGMQRDTELIEPRSGNRWGRPAMRATAVLAVFGSSLALATSVWATTPLSRAPKTGGHDPGPALACRARMLYPNQRRAFASWKLNCVERCACADHGVLVITSAPAALPVGIAVRVARKSGSLARPFYRSSRSLAVV
jgi:hypothetical protein